ncbi:hypothetical protein EOD10_01495 [Mesorhizobium sp. M7A.T.Ca.TU.009.01.3.2]|nr:hypothetical protein EOD10_01495 [Mesorhizobium sp. M7A.T.Ca.TU.009.01.3.2]RUV07909.1 hypothetical protein EOD00_19190 [Mesorhizobium sp. M7A.T.Ca.TU.009.01.3.1]
MSENRRLVAILAPDVIGYSRSPARTKIRLASGGRRGARRHLPVRGRHRQVKARLDLSVSDLGTRGGMAGTARVNPDYSLEYRRKVLPYKNPADFELMIDGSARSD